MTAAACKAAACSAGCLATIRNDQVREFLEAIRELSANNQFNDQEMDLIIDKTEEFMFESEKLLVEREDLESGLKADLLHLVSL